MAVHCSFSNDIAHYSLNRRLLQLRSEHLARLLKLEGADVSVVFLGDAEMAAYNEQYRRKNGPTNVLSFPAAEGGEGFVAPENELGDILISVDTARREAGQQGHSLHHRLTQLIIHGMLHLIGYDHERSEEEAVRMWDYEQELFQQLQTTRSTAMPFLAINVDHVATIRQARGGQEPDPVLAASLCELAGADGIVVHLREDRRHIQDRDVRLLRQTVKTKLNLEMANVPEIVDIAVEVVPDMVTLVPEKRKELTTEGGLDVLANAKKLTKTIDKMRKAGIPVSLFVDADAAQVQAALDVGATFVELHTGRYCEARTMEEQEQQFRLIEQTAELAYESGLRVNAGHGLDYRNTHPIAALPYIEELSIGHAVISRAVLVGLENAVREMLTIVRSV
ncbi:pyridoxine 5'-phosphate synthase [Desulfobulbus propionicus DSM 2032]|uniref:Multifunctional fusion protein n=1 Tax=Desulfobulbus propionicus (strain ATCC 33891 / DSM 2032 / VKM B-1956 / 1pr3) TaxID=577650 RepID=A0A7U4DNU2_DESPD|nr:pyridoxine 5'-phosphate synthase [Desulfobulbus propionicus]ADW17456.1 pyridoxine 5'-phosphate synthase [Desulfobulbus propionicus DSM 2032]